MEFRQIKSFQQVATLKSFSNASKLLFLSQPTVTAHILELEKELDVKLLVRNRSKVELTEAGVFFLNYVNQITALEKEALGGLASLKKGQKGTLRIGLSGADYYWLVPLLGNFTRYYSDVDVVLSILWCDETVNSIVNRNIHFGIIRDEYPVFNHPLLNSKIVDKDKVVIVFSPNHKFAKLDELNISDISKEPLIAYAKKTSFWTNQLMKLFHTAGVEPNVSLESTDHQAVKMLLQSSWGLAFLPYKCVKQEIDTGILKTLPIKNCQPIIRYSILIYRKDLQLNEATNSILNKINRFSEDIDCIKSSAVS